MNSHTAPATWDAFKNVLTVEFIPADRLHKLKQIGSVVNYLAEFRNIILMIPEMNEGEQLDRFIEGLKYSVKIEVMKSACNNFEDCARMALNLDSAILRARRGRPNIVSSRSEQPFWPTPMEIGNINLGASSRAHREQCKKDMSNGACFRCHKPGFRPWKCKPSRVNNIVVDNSDRVTERENVVFSDSENE